DTPTVTDVPQHPAGTVRHRLSVAKLNEPQLDNYRLAITEAGQFTPGDNRGYQWFAGQHGIPGNFCQHHTQSEHGRRFFLPWHRAYLYFFELALRSEERRVGKECRIGGSSVQQQNEIQCEETA